ncbi:MAG: type II CAAX prenyl endopeptidase Rce1 family protein [Limisphaerales bacterium]
MRAFLVILAYLLFVFIGGALVAPWVYHAARALAGLWPPLAGIADAPFHRYVNRCLLVLALAGLWPLLRRLGVRRWRDLGWTLAGTPGRDLTRGLLVSWLGLALVAAAALAMGARVWRADRDTADIAGYLLKSVLAALVVATLEETLFRGGLFRALRREWSFAGAAAVSAAIYSWVHFFERPPRPESVDAWTGLVTLVRMLRGFTQPEMLVPGWLTLFVVGWVLARAVELRGSLWLALGLHAGWIFWIKSFGFWTAAKVPEAARWLGSNRLYDGWLALLVIVLTGWLIGRLGKNPAPASRPALVPKSVADD